MSLGEKLYLAVVVSTFASFIVLMGTLSWLDGREDKVRRKQTRDKALDNRQVGSVAEQAGAHR